MDVKFLYEGLKYAHKEGTVSYKEISKAIWKIIDFKKPIKSISEITKASNVSYSLVSKYIKFINIENAKVMISLINSAIKLEKAIENCNHGDLEVKVAEAIEKARKILFIGVSSNYYVNSKFGVKLSRLDIWTEFPISKYEQIGLSHLQTEGDLIIMTSTSLQHTWMKKILRESKGKKVLLTTSEEKNADLIFKFDSKERSDAFRVYTIDTIIGFEVFLGAVFKKIASKKENRLLLNMTRYSE